MNIFRKLRWKLTLSYTIVTISAFLVVLIILGVIIFPRLLTRVFVPVYDWYPEDTFRAEYYGVAPLFGRVLSQTPVDTELIALIIEGLGPNPTISNIDLFRVGSFQFYVNTVADIRRLIIGADGTLLGKSEGDFPQNLAIGKPFDPTEYQGLEYPYQQALAGVTIPSNLYTVYARGNRYVLAVPIFDPLSENEKNVLGVMVVFVDSLPTQKDIPSNILTVSVRSLLIFLFCIGIMGALFGTFFAHGLSTRFKRLSTTIDEWSKGDFSRFILDTSRDEISQLAERLNNMARQLQELLRRRQDMAASEERNRLARDLHDSAKQQALAASFQLGTALALFESDPKNAKKHLVEADALVDSVRNELTNLVLELRPHTFDGYEFPEVLKDYTLDWSQSSGIEVDFNVEGSDEISLETKEALFRISQEALANVARHSAASNVTVWLKYEANDVTLTIKDNGKGFELEARHSGLGLASMRERTVGLGGSCSVESKTGQGTLISVSLPTHK